MLIKKIKYTDYAGVEREEEFFFNLSKAELMEMQLGTSGGLEKKLQKIIESKDIPQIVEVFKDIIKKSYGVLSPDGKRFIKKEELTEEFLQTEAYSELFMQLGTNSDEALAFINGIIPSDLKDSVDKASIEELLPKA